MTPNPADPHQPGTAGPLSIDYVSNIHFGSKQIQAGTAIYSAQLDQDVYKRQAYVFGTATLASTVAEGGSVVMALSLIHI